MKRKVIQLAHKTFVVSLPSKWVKKQGIKKGDELEAEEHASSMVFSTEQKKNIEKASLDITNTNERTIRWLLSSLHKKGYDEIELTYDSPDKTRIIHELVKDLFIGFAVVHQSSKRCVLRAIAQDRGEEFENVLRRSFLVTLSMAEGMLDYMERGHQKQLSDLTALEKTNNQLTNFCERTLNKMGHLEYAKTCFYYVIVWNLEKICDDYKYICELLSNSTEKISKESLELLKETNKFLRAYYDLFYTFDIQQLNRLSERKKEMITKAHKLISLKKGAESAMLSYLTSMIYKISDFSASMISLNTN